MSKAKRRSHDHIDFPVPGCRNPECGESLWRARRLRGATVREDLDFWANGQLYGRGVCWQPVECRKCGRRANLRMPLEVAREQAETENTEEGEE